MSRYISCFPSTVNKTTISYALKFFLSICVHFTQQTFKLSDLRLLHFRKLTLIRNILFLFFFSFIEPKLSTDYTQ